MNKYTRILTALSMIAVITAVSCSNNNSASISDRQNINSLIVSDTEVNETVTSTESEATQSDEDFIYFRGISAGVKDEVSSYVYNGSDIAIPYQYSIDGAKSFGIMVLCDGIPTNFSTDIDTEKKQMHIIQNKNQGEEMDIPLYVTPIGKKGETISIQLVDIVEPDFVFSEKESSEPGKYLVYGQKSVVNYLNGITVKMESDGSAFSEEKYMISETADIPKEIIDENISIDENGKVQDQLASLHCDWLINGEQSLRYSLVQGEKLELSMQYYGTAGKDVTSFFFVDNKPFPVFENKMYSECFVDKKHYTTIKAEIDTSEMEKGLHICYSVAGIDQIYNKCSPTDAFIIEVK